VYGPLPPSISGYRFAGCCKVVAYGASAAAGC
jgi:hypothetical protein